jgi:hypothetical protein
VVLNEKRGLIVNVVNLNQKIIDKAAKFLYDVIGTDPNSYGPYVFGSIEKQWD